MTEQTKAFPKPSFPGVSGDMPERKTTSINFSIDDGVISLAKPELNQPDADLSVAYSILKRETLQLSDALRRTNVDQRLGRSLANFSQCISDDIQHVDAIRLGLEGQF